jgi:tetratricopeptide (TPR) repeat protein
VDAACAAGGACVDVEAALAFVDGELADARRDEVERKIDACARCRGVVAEAARDAVRTVRDRPVSQEQIAPGTMVGRYVVERAIGAGGMGVVSLARDPELRRAVVIKLVRPDFGEGRDDLEARLRREAQAMAQLSHPNVVQIFDLGRHGDRVFLAMEFVPGQTLDSWLIEKARPIPEILAMFRLAGAGLDAAHRSGLVHRDFKPSNVLVTTDGVPKVTDFGLARSVAAPGASTSLPRATGLHSVLTQANAVMGTPAYMPPEQAAGLPVDERGDQYAFALALLDALLGQPPTARRVRPGDGLGDALADAGIEARLRTALVRALALEPEARFPAMADLLRELAAPKRERRWPLALALALAGGAIAVTVVLATRSESAGCVAKAPARWATGRGDAVAKLAALDQPFASWAAKRTAGAVDAAVARLGTDEVARCQGGTIDTACLKRRMAALDRVLAGDDAVRALERCDEPDPAIARELATLEGELPAATHERARAIAARATALGDDRTLAFALDRAGRAALAAGDIDGAERDFAELATVGNRVGDDVARGLAHLGLLEIAGRRSSLATATTHADALRALLAQYGATPRDEVAIARVEATVFGELGDARRALRAWDAARVAALQLGGDDALTVQIGRARARHALQLDLAGARADATAALAAAATASPAARAAAQVALAELALAAGDARAAIAANAEAKRIDPARVAVADLIRDARGRAAAGDLEVALASLPAARPPDQDEPDPNRTSDAIRVAVGRATILHAAGRSADALAVLASALKPVMSAVLERDSGAIAMPAGERAEALVLRCEIEVVVGDFGLGCYDAQQALDKLHPKAPLRVRYLAAKTRDRRERPNGYVEHDVLQAIDILTVAGAPPPAIADLRWDLARDPNVSPRHARAHAAAARVLYAGVGRTAEVAAIDRWLAGGDAGDAGVGGDASGDPWSTAP